jgi:hypothetical protein
MRCRHTVPDWHRFVAAGEGGAPIFAACRLLTKDGDRVSDPRSIACGYWGHQEDCPLYDGPGKRPDVPRVVAPVDEQAPVEEPWPVRPPGAVDGSRILLIALATLSVALLMWAALLGLRPGRGAGMTEGSRILVAGAAAVSILTHILAVLRIWARR